ncbi:hypothetical protein B0A49_14003, partial [Cryomyces minteri]
WLAATKDIMRALYLKYRQQQQQQQPKQQLSPQSRELSDFERYNQLDDLEAELSIGHSTFMKVFMNVNAPTSFNSMNANGSAFMNS